MVEDLAICLQSPGLAVQKLHMLGLSVQLAGGPADMTVAPGHPARAGSGPFWGEPGWETHWPGWFEGRRGRILAVVVHVKIIFPLFPALNTPLILLSPSAISWVQMNHAFLFLEIR